MRNVVTLTWLTFHEAWRRRMVLAALVLGALFLMVYAIGVSLIIGEIRRNGGLLDLTQNFLLLAGFYVVHFLTIMLSIFASVDTISGEIASHTIQTIVTKPVRRWEIVAGKWLGYLAMIGLYLGMLGGGIVLICYLISGYTPPNFVHGVLLLALEAVVMLSLSLLGGTRFSTLTNGVVLFMLYGLAFIGGWVEQIGSLLQSQAAVRVGIISSLVLPVEALWRRTTYLMQSPLANNIPTPFSTASVPSPAMVVYALIYTVASLLIAMRAFGRRDL